MLKQPIITYIKEDLDRQKIVMIAGPRQVGKTRLSWNFLEDAQKFKRPEEHPAYLNWDSAQDRETILRMEFPTNYQTLIFDEIHKYENWRNYLKGIYDKLGRKYKIIVTGSARLDFYRHGGDSLQGRYFFYRLHPLSFFNCPIEEEAFQKLLKFGGFPEPFLEASPRFYSRWQNLRRSRLIQEDLFSLEKVREVAKVDLLMTLLPDRVGSILSINSIREDLNVAHNTAAHWIEILENLYFCFRVAPFASTKVKSMKKEQKLFLWDWSLAKNGIVENFLASMLLKYCHFQEDVEGKKLELRFLRDKEKREIDFLIIEDGKIHLAVECKSNNKNPSKHWKYFLERLEISNAYQVYLGSDDFLALEGRLRILPMETFVKEILRV